MSRSSHGYSYFPVLLGLIGTGAIFLALLLLTSWPLYLNWLIAFSVVTFALFGVDKGLAKAGRARIPEVVLHAFTLLGGFPGQLLGRLVFRHKINFGRHPAFNIVLIVSIILWAVLAYFIFLRP
jgi:uncharacterized membrane protein YsdA (DUF1294 family)